MMVGSEPWVLAVAHAAIVGQDPDKADLKTWVSSCEEQTLSCCMDPD